MAIINVRRLNGDVVECFKRRARTRFASGSPPSRPTAGHPPFAVQRSVA